MSRTEENALLGQLIKAIASCESEEELSALLSDLCTVYELEEMAQRFELAKGLYCGETYESLRKRLGVSNTTITRVSSALSYGAGGYKSVLVKIERNEKHRERH